MRWFGAARRSFLDPELEAWHRSTWLWLLRETGGIEALRRRPLVTPTRTYFTSNVESGHGRVEDVFEQVKRHVGLADWPCRLLAQPHQPELRVGELATLRRDNATPAGTFGLEGNEPAVTYDPALEQEPVKLIAVLAHELMHLRLMSFGTEVPGGREANERATDLATVAMGFGLFGANVAFNFQRHQDSFSQGWQYSRLGYLDEREWVFALAVFFELARHDPELGRRHLKDYLFSDLRRAVASLQARPAFLQDFGV